MWASSYVLALALWAASGAPIPPCPDGCACQVLEDSRQELTCSSMHFLEHLQTESAASIAALHLRHLNLTAVDGRLSALPALEKLDLAHNLISSLRNVPALPKLKSLNLNNNLLKDVAADLLPRALANVDISNNKINHIPKSFLDLKELKSLYLKDNPISCTCDTIVVRDKLLRAGVVFPDRVECRSPLEHSGKTWQDVQCETSENDLFDDMIGDAFGSGEEEGSGATTTPFEEDYLPVATDAAGTYPDLDPDSDPEPEGSGDIFFHTSKEEEEGSGHIEEPVVTKETAYPVAKACHFNCSTPKPVVANSTAAPPSLIDGINILMDDLSGKETQHASTQAPSPRKEGVKKTDVQVLYEPDKNKGVELERQLEEPNTKMSTTFMIVCGLLALMICLVVYSVYKRRAQRRRRRPVGNKEPEGKEMQPIEPREKLPLINGQNGTGGAKPSEPPRTEDVADYPKHEEQDEDEEEEVELRSKEQDNLLTPKMERVTIQAKELSAPKTPILVNRQFNDDGSLVTTPTHEH